jgi:hypothetical protein
LRSKKLHNAAEAIEADGCKSGFAKLTSFLLSESQDSEVAGDSDMSLRVHPGETIPTSSDSKIDSPFNQSESGEMNYNDELLDASINCVEQEVLSETGMQFDNFNEDGGFYQTSSAYRPEPIFGALDRGITPSTTWRTRVLCRLFNSNVETMCDLEEIQRHGLRRVNSRAIAEAFGVPHTPDASHSSVGAALHSRGLTAARPRVPPLNLAVVHHGEEDEEEDEDDFENKVGFANAQHAFALNQHGRKSTQILLPVPRLNLPSVKTLSSSSAKGIAAPQRKFFSSSSDTNLFKALPTVLASKDPLHENSFEKPVKACAKPQISVSQSTSLPMIQKSMSTQFLGSKSRTSNASRARRGQKHHRRLLHSIDASVSVVTHSHLHIHYHVSNPSHEREAGIHKAKVLPVEVS